MRLLLLLILLLNSLPVTASPAAFALGSSAFSEENALGSSAFSEKKALGDWAFDGSRRAGKLVFSGKPVSVGTVYMQHRYMDPSLGQFLSEDPSRGSLMAPMGMQGYTYANASPMAFTDPDGRFIGAAKAFNALIGEVLHQGTQAVLSGLTSVYKTIGLDSVADFVEEVGLLSGSFTENNGWARESNNMRRLVMPSDFSLAGFSEKLHLFLGTQNTIEDAAKHSASFSSTAAGIYDFAQERSGSTGCMEGVFGVDSNADAVTGAKRWSRGLGGCSQMALTILTVGQRISNGSSAGQMRRALKAEKFVSKRGITISTSKKRGMSVLEPESILSGRQKRVHKQLARSNSEVMLHKREVSMNDLRQITRVTGDEYNMFTRGSRRFVIRGKGGSVKVTNEMFSDIKAGRYGKYSGHTHPPKTSSMPGPGDRPFLQAQNQARSGIWGLETKKPFVFWASDEIEQKARSALNKLLYGGE